jgi:hypothetical protein
MEIDSSTSDFKNYLDKYYYNGEEYLGGDSIEKKMGLKVIDLFPNSEQFWRLFIVPMTNRIDKDYIGDDWIGLRNILFKTGSDLIDISRLNYSVLFNLISAYKCIEEKNKEEKRISFFENFYAHLGTIGDITEEFIIQVFSLINECKKDSKEYLEIRNEIKDADKWSKKDKRNNVFKRYFNQNRECTEYLNAIGLIKNYRNAIMHNPKIPGLYDKNKVFVPKKEVIEKYMKWHQVHAIDARKDNNLFKSDFIEQFELMEVDFNTIKKRLNDLWEKPINDLNQLLYIDKNLKLLQMYDLHFNN